MEVKVSQLKADLRTASEKEQFLNDEAKLLNEENGLFHNLVASALVRITCLFFPLSSAIPLPVQSSHLETSFGLPLFPPFSLSLCSCVYLNLHA